MSIPFREPEVARGSARWSMQPVSFVVRLWADAPGQASRPEWRFHALHVQSGREVYGCTLLELKRFVESLTEIPGPPLARDLGEQTDRVPPDEVS